MQLAEVALVYWQRCRHLQGLANKLDRDFYLENVIAPQMSFSYDPNERRLLQKLMDRK